MTSTDPGTGPVTVVTARVVTDGHEDEFQQWAHRLTAVAETFPGFLGWGMLRPAPGDTVWHVVYRFDSPRHLATWEASDVRTELLAHGAEFMETVAVRRLDGLDTWFAPTPSPSGPPRWKTFLMTATVIVILQTLISTLLRPLVADWPTFPRTVVVIIPVVALMTWLVMPQLSRRLSTWLYRD